MEEITEQEGSTQTPQQPAANNDNAFKMRTEWGIIPQQCTCQFCGENVITRTRLKPGLLAWISAGFLCLFGCFLGCCLIPFCVDAFQDVEHQCPHCHRIVGIGYRLAVN